MDKVIILTGGTSGIGQATAKALRAAGCRVYEFSRRPAQPDLPCHYSVDVADDAQVRAAVESVYALEGHIDVLINNAGFGISGAMEFTDPNDARRLMEVNLFGMNNMIRAVLPYMRQARRGRIVNLSSVAAVLPIPFQAWYSISKAAVNAMTMALANEVAAFGIQAVSIMPGDIRTGFTAARQKSVVGDETYQGRISRSVARMERDERNGMTPEAAARFIARIALKRRVKPYYAIGASYKFFVMLSRLLPCRVIQMILGRLYAHDGSANTGTNSSQSAKP